MKGHDEDQHSVCKVEGHHNHDELDNNPNRLCCVAPSGEAALWPPSPRFNLVLLA